MRIVAGCSASAIRTGALIVVAWLAAAGLQAAAQAQSGDTGASKTAVTATYSGCVHKAADDPTRLAISTPTVCARLEGQASSAALDGHLVELQGVLTPSSGQAAASIQVKSVISVGRSCSDVCSLHRPGTRGLQRPSNNAVPGSEGGTPGLTTAPHP